MLANRNFTRSCHILSWFKIQQIDDFCILPFSNVLGKPSVLCPESYTKITIFFFQHFFSIYEHIQRYLQIFFTFNSLSANPTKWSNTLKQFVGNFPTNCLSVVDDFVILALKGLNKSKRINSFTYKYKVIIF